jgi:hypothetical protein
MLLSQHQETVPLFRRMKREHGEAIQADAATAPATVTGELSSTAVQAVKATESYRAIGKAEEKR